MMGSPKPVTLPAPFAAFYLDAEACVGSKWNVGRLKGWLGVTYNCLCCMDSGSTFMAASWSSKVCYAQILRDLQSNKNDIYVNSTINITFQAANIIATRFTSTTSELFMRTIAIR